MKQYNAINEANKLYNKLVKAAKANPDIFCENYGMPDIAKFEENMNKKEVPYAQIAIALRIVYRITEFTPH